VGVNEWRSAMGGFSAVWCVGLVVGSAMAQVAPPPPGAPAPKPEYVRPEFKPVVPAAIKPTRARPDMTQVEYDSLVVVGDNGKVVRIGRPVALASLKNNPLLGPEQWEALEPWLVQRREKMELLVIENVDSAVEIDFGIIDEIYSEQQEQFSGIMDLIRPVSITNAIGDDLRGADLFSPEQAELNNLIAMDYRGKLIEEIQKNYVPEPGDESTNVDMILRYVFWENVQEPMAAYHGLLIEAAPQLNGWLDDLEVEDESATAISTLMAGYNEELDNDATLAIMRKVIDQLETAQVRSMLEKVVAARDAG